MHLTNGRIVLSATDVTRHIGCPHSTTLDLAVAEGRLRAPADGIDDQLQLVLDRGREHELAYLDQLRADGREVVEIPGTGRVDEREHLTEQAMRRGAEVVYQATLFDGTWQGHADFLLRDDTRSSALGPWAYDVADTKLARHLKVPALLQMAGYAERLTELQGVPPRRLVVVTGDGAAHPVRLVDVEAYARRVRTRVLEAVTDPLPTASAPVAACAQCRWLTRCTAEWEAADDLSLVAGMRSDHREALVAAGVTTLRALAEADDDDLAVLPRGSAQRLRSQARLQLQERETGRPAYELLGHTPGLGLALLPEPDPGDVYLDFEGDPFAEGGSLEYLAGVWTREGEFLPWWAHDRDEEATLTGDLLGWLVERWRAHPGMHVYHYANYEQAALKRLAQQHATGETELDMLLRGERFVDLYAVVRQGLQISKGSYSIKKLEDFYWGHTRSGVADEVTDALSSVVEYERWRSTGRPEDGTLQRLAAYNREDVRSTHDLHAWLEERRAELQRDRGVVLDRPDGKALKESGDSEQMAAENAMAERLLAVGQDLLAGCVGWHRREQKSEWWDYYRTASMTLDELTEDGATIGGVGEPAAVGTVKKSTIWRYPFPPQDTKLRAGKTAKDAWTHEGVGRVCAIDPDEGWIEISRLSSKEPLRPRALAAEGPISDEVLRASLMRLGEEVLAGHPSTGACLLERHVPAGLSAGAGETPSDVVRRVGAGLRDGQVLAVQGPPGTGKTHTGSLLIRDLMDAGLTVGVTALSHSVIANLMDRVGRPGVRKPGGGAEIPEHQPSDGIRLVDANQDVVAALGEGTRLVGGTAWLWARDDMAGSVDVLVIDEAGQFSLANALAVAQAARCGVVLLGDPQQLAQPTKGTHPHGADVSVLEHLLEGHETIPVDRGVFLDRTWRMHPAITGFVSTLAYDDRLGSAPGCQHQEVDAPGGLTGSGLRWVPVEHSGNVADSPQEAAVVAGLVRDLLRGEWTDSEGTVLPLTPEDVLVVAPYNAHVQCLAAAVPAGVRVGTVDKFQGREGAVVIYAMGSSSAEDAPRGVSFLYDPHRLNVAVSRARALAVIVGSTDLLRAPVRTPEQLRAVNALCRFVDQAESVLPGARRTALGAGR